MVSETDNQFNWVNSMGYPSGSPKLDRFDSVRSEALPLYDSSKSRVSDTLEYVECGTPPPDDDTPNIYDYDDESSEEIPNDELSLPVCYNNIRMILLDFMSLSFGRKQLLDDIESKKIVQDNLENTFLGASKLEINISLLWSAFMKRWDLIEVLIRIGAELNFYEPHLGLGALHLVSFSGCIPGTQFLISQGCDVNAVYKCFAPIHCAAFSDSLDTAIILVQNGARVQALTNSPAYLPESSLHCAVRANAINCVRLLTHEGADVGQIEFSGMSPIHLAADLGHAECLKILLNAKGVNVNAKTKDKEHTPLHFSSKSNHHECVLVLLQAGADANLKNCRGQTPLHLATRAQSYRSVKFLLEIGNANPNIEDCDKRTPLHTAVGKTNKSCDIIEVLMKYGGDANKKDQYGYTPLHIAALKEHSRCVETLIFNDADVTAKSKSGLTVLGVIMRKIPASVATITQKLDSAISFSHSPESSNGDVELRLDFRCILRNTHPREISFLNTFVDEGQKEILLHPLCSAFLYLKWEKIRKYYIARIFFSFLFVLSLSLYVLTALAHNCYNHGKSMNETEPHDDIELCEKQSMMGYMLRANPFVVEMQWFVLVAITLCEVLRKIYGIAGYSSVKQYFSYGANIIEWAVIASVFVISFIYTGRTYTWQNHVGAFAVLFSWTNLMLMIGQLPIFGLYVAMYTRVQREFAKLLLAYSCLLIGFAISFCVIFPESATFANPFISLIAVVTMMTGELSLDLLADEDPDDPPFLLEVSAQVTYILFVLFVTVILMNLLVGIAVDDIQGLQKNAGLSKLVRQTKLISQMEVALFNGSLPQHILNLLHWTALVSPKAYRVVLNVRPLNPREKRLPNDILKAAYHVANRQQGHKVYSTENNICVINNNNKDEKKEMGEYNNALITMQRRIDERTRQVEQLSKEIKNLKISFEKSQRSIEHLLRTILISRRSSKF